MTVVDQIMTSLMVCSVNPFTMQRNTALKIVSKIVAALVYGFPANVSEDPRRIMTVEP